MMRSILRVTALILVLLALLLPVVSYASGGPCPDDPVASKNCDPEAPPYYVVLNRSEEHLADRPGTGCQPWILNHPECKDCTGKECEYLPPVSAGSPDIEAEVCGPMLSMRKMDNGQDPILYEMCCDCTTTEGTWKFRIREWRSDGTCPVTQPKEGWITGLPPGTGIDLPVPFIVGGLTIIGVGLLAAGLLVRRRALRTT
jgi:hypothetical protein